MFRVKGLNGEPVIDEGKAIVIEYFGLNANEVSVHEAPNTYILDLRNNIDAQEKYKVVMPWGNTGTPKKYDFTKSILVFWNGTKIQAA